MDVGFRGEKVFTYLCIFRLLLSLRVDFGDFQSFELVLLIHLSNQYTFISSSSVAYTLMEAVLLWLFNVAAFFIRCLLITKSKKCKIPRVASVTQ